GVIGGAVGIAHALELRAGEAIERPALGALLAGRRGRAVERALALAAIEAGELAARQRGPDHALAVDVDAARTIGALRRLVDLGQRGLRRVRARQQPDDVARLVEAREADIHRLAPDRIVDRARLHAVERRQHALVLGRIDRLVGLDPGVALAVAVGVDDQRRPALRRHLVA